MAVDYRTEFFYNGATRKDHLLPFITEMASTHEASDITVPL